MFSTGQIEAKFKGARLRLEKDDGAERRLFDGKFLVFPFPVTLAAEIHSQVRDRAFDQDGRPFPEIDAVSFGHTFELFTLRLHRAVDDPNPVVVPGVGVHGISVFHPPKSGGHVALEFTVTCEVDNLTPLNELVLLFGKMPRLTFERVQLSLLEDDARPSGPVVDAARRFAKTATRGGTTVTITGGGRSTTITPEDAARM